MSSPLSFLPFDALPTLVAAGATASVVYNYRYTLARHGLLGYSYLKRALLAGPLVAPLLNADACKGSGADADSTTETESGNVEHPSIVHLFPHVETVTFDYDTGIDTDEDGRGVDRLTATQLTPAQETELRTAICQWRAVPLDDVCQHLSLYEVLRSECARHWGTPTFPRRIVLTYDALLLELTHTTPPVATELAGDGSCVCCLEAGPSNTLRWPSVSPGVSSGETAGSDATTSVAPADDA